MTGINESLRIRYFWPSVASKIKANLRVTYPLQVSTSLAMFHTVIAAATRIKVMMAGSMDFTVPVRCCISDDERRHQSRTLPEQRAEFRDRIVNVFAFARRESAD